jgi:predicted SAM-dependent methyltransferase
MIKKLHLGCGNKRLEGFINVDIYKNDATDLVQDISNLELFQDESVDEVYACHVLEHFHRNQFKNVLNEWCRVLKKGGTLRLSVPDFEKICSIYSKTKNLNQLLGLLYGGQNYEYNFHYCTFDFDSLSSILTELGFQDIKRYDWRAFLPVNFDDFSRAYIPHMDFENGTLMSLNIICFKS